MSWADGFVFNYAYDAQNEMTSITDSAGIVTAQFTYDNLGRRVTRTAGNSTSTTYTYDGASNLSSLALSGSSPVTISIGSRSPAGQIMSRSIDNASYTWNKAANASASYTTDGQNRYATIAGLTQGYDPKSNLNSSLGFTATYGIENTMTTMNTTNPVRTVNLIYDAYGRLVYDSFSGRFDYDGDQLVTELSSTGTIMSRYAFGPGTDEPLVWYPTSGTGSRRYFDADERGSIIRVANATGTVLNINTYDEYGLPGTTNSGSTAGRFQYTGQAYMPELGLYNYKARFYSPSMGRFVQPDPTGLSAGPNIYNYAGADPVNYSDPSGLDSNDQPGYESPKFDPPCTEANDCYTIRGNPLAPLLGYFGAFGNAGPIEFDLSSGGSPSVPRPQSVKTAPNKITTKDIAGIKKKMIEACAADPNGRLCASLKEEYKALFKAYNGQNPLPPIGHFENDKPDVGELLVGIAGCGTGVATGGGGAVGAAITAAGCAYTARDLGNLFIPPQRRVVE